LRLHPSCQNDKQAKKSIYEAETVGGWKTLASIYLAWGSCDKTTETETPALPRRATSSTPDTKRVLPYDMLWTLLHMLDDTKRLPCKILQRDFKLFDHGHQNKISLKHVDEILMTIPDYMKEVVRTRVQKIAGSRDFFTFQDVASFQIDGKEFYKCLKGYALMNNDKDAD